MLLINGGKCVSKYPYVAAYRYVSVCAWGSEFGSRGKGTDSDAGRFY